MKRFALHKHLHGMEFAYICIFWQELSSYPLECWSGDFPLGGHLLGKVMVDSMTLNSDQRSCSNFPLHYVSIFLPESTSPASNKRNPNPTTLPILYILIPKELNQQPLLPSNSRTKKLPQNQCICHETNHIPHHNLRPQSPPEIPKITRMSQPGVYPCLHQPVTRVLVVLHYVVEIRACGGHCVCSNPLSQEDERQTEGKDDIVDGGG